MPKFHIFSRGTRAQHLTLSVLCVCVCVCVCGRYVLFVPRGTNILLARQKTEQCKKFEEALPLVYILELMNITSNKLITIANFNKLAG